VQRKEAAHRVSAVVVHVTKTVRCPLHRAPCAAPGSAQLGARSSRARPSREGRPLAPAGRSGCRRPRPLGTMAVTTRPIWIAHALQGSLAFANLPQGRRPSPPRSRRSRPPGASRGSKRLMSCARRRRWLSPPALIAPSSARSSCLGLTPGRPSPPPAGTLVRAQHTTLYIIGRSHESPKRSMAVATRARRDRWPMALRRCRWPPRVPEGVDGNDGRALQQ
jgi:hypothetical protein